MKTKQIAVLMLGITLSRLTAPGSDSTHPSATKGLDTKTKDVQTAVFQEIDVYLSGSQGYHTYRIPAIVVAPNGDLLAFAEGRKTGRSDSGQIDLVLRQSKDKGQHWGPMQVVWSDDGNTCGNPCPIVDRDTGIIWLLMTHNLGRDRESEIINGTSEGSRSVWITHSSDNGGHWSPPVEVTASTKQANWTWYATGPGAGIQLTKGRFQGRLVIPCDHIEAGTKRYYSHVIYSDNHGQTWALGGSTPQDQVNECEVVELVDSRLMLTMRNYDRSKTARAVSLSDDGGKTWSTVRHDAKLIEPICQASIRRYNWPDEQDTLSRILFSNPAHTSSRANMTVRLSLDEGRQWPIAKQIYAGSSAYSCLAVLPDKTIACLHERDNYGRITLTRFSLAWLMDGATPPR